MKVEIATLDGEDIHIITDCMSLEQWWTNNKQQEKGVII